MEDELNFNNLWKNHPNIGSDGKPCDLKQVTNYCAVNMGVSLTACGIDTYKIVSKNEHCWAQGHTGHVLRAEVLAKGLIKNPFNGLGSLQKIASEDFNISLAGKTGIIFYKDYWRRGNESFINRSGDHIDLWDGSETTSAGWLRLNWVPEIHIGSWGWSDLEDSKEIWFWAVA